LERLKNEIDELDMKMLDPDFWNDVKEAQKVVQESKALKDKLNEYTEILNSIDDIDIFFQLAYEEPLVF